MMKKHARACAAAAAIALIAQTGMAQETGQQQRAADTEPLQAHIAIQWQGDVQGLARTLAERMALSYSDQSGGYTAHVNLSQNEDATVGQAMEAINNQLTSAGVQLRLAPGSQGQQLELTRTAIDRAVASVTTQPPASVAPVAAPPATASQQWQLSTADGTLRSALGKWTKQAGWQLSWEASADVPIPVTASFEGDFPSAVKALFNALSASEVSLAALLYGGNQVLRVTESGHRSK